MSKQTFTLYNSSRKLTPLGLSILATTLVSGVAIALAWTGPSSSPFSSNVAIPINVGGVDQVKSATISANGLISNGGLIVTGYSTTSKLIITGAGANWAGINTTSLQALSSIYSYGSACTGNSLGDCTGTGGAVMGGANTTANVNITNSGNTFFNGGNVGFGTNNPTQAPVVVKAPASLGDATSSLSFLTASGNTYGYIYGSGGNGVIRMQHEGGGTYTEMGARYGSAYFSMKGSGNSTIFRLNNNGTNYWDIGLGVSSGNNDTYAISYNYGAQLFSILSTGNIGIGTTTPTTKLSVAGTIYSSVGGFAFPDGTTQTTAAGAGQWTTSGSHIYNANTGNVGVGASPSGIAKLYVSNGVAGQTAFQVGGIGGANMYIDNAGAGTNYIRGTTYAFNNIWYDESNTAYYIDPSSTSQLNTVNTGALTASNVISSGLTANSFIYSNASKQLTTGVVSAPLSFSAGTLSLGTVGVANGGTGSISQTTNGVTYYNGTNIISGSGLTFSGSNLTVSGTVTATSFIYSSDRNLKENILPLESSLDKISALNGYSFNWKKDGKADVGIIAQEVEKIYPALVHTDEATGLKSVEYGNLVAPIIEAIKTLANNFNSLSARVFNTESRQTQLEKQNQAQQAQIDSLQRQITELSKRVR